MSARKAHIWGSGPNIDCETRAREPGSRGETVGLERCDDLIGRSRLLVAQLRMPM